MSRLAAVQWVGGALIALSIGALALRVQEADGRVAALRDQVALDRADFDAERARIELEQLNAKQEAFRFDAMESRATAAEKTRDTLHAELLTANDRLEKAYKDIAEMEKQLVDVSRAKNDIEQQLAYLRDRVPNLGDLAVEPKIDGVVLGVSDKVNLILISVGGKDKVQVGYKFTVYRGSAYVSKLVVDKVEDGWAACRELTDFRKDAIQQGDNVSTRVFD